MRFTAVAFNRSHTTLLHCSTGGGRTSRSSGQTIYWRRYTTICRHGSMAHAHIRTYVISLITNAERARLSLIGAVASTGSTPFRFGGVYSARRQLICARASPASCRHR